MFGFFEKRSFSFLICFIFLFNICFSLPSIEPSRQFTHSFFDLDTSFLDSPLDTDGGLPDQIIESIDPIERHLPEKDPQPPVAPLPVSESLPESKDLVPKISVTQLTGNLLSIANHFNKYESNFLQTISQLNPEQIQNALVDLSSIQYTSVNYMIDQIVCVDLIGKVRSRGATHRSIRALMPSYPNPPRKIEKKEDFRSLSLSKTTSTSFDVVDQRNLSDSKEVLNPASLSEEPSPCSQARPLQLELPYGNSKRIGKDSQNYVFWGDFFGNIQKQARQNQFPDLYSESVGALLGLEVVGFNNGWMGATAGYARSYFGDQNNFGSTSTNSYFMGLYGAGYPGIVFIEVAAFGGFNKTKSTQNLYFGETKISTKASFDSAEIAPHLSVGYDVGWEWAVLEPYLSIDFVYNWIFNFQEHNDFKKVSFSNSSMLRAELGLHAYQETKNANSTYSFQETVGFVNKTFFRMGRTKTSFSFLSDSTPLVITDFKSPQNLFTFGLNFLFRNKNGFFTSFAYQGEFGSKFFLNDVRLDLGVYF